MRKLREWILRCGGLFNKQRKDRGLDDEIESHLQMHIEDNLRSGMSPEEAQRQAIIKLGGFESTKEAYRDHRGLPVLETLWRQLTASATRHQSPSHVGAARRMRRVISYLRGFAPIQRSGDLPVADRNSR